MPRAWKFSRARAGEILSDAKRSNFHTMITSKRHRCGGCNLRESANEGLRPATDGVGPRDSPPFGSSQRTAERVIEQYDRETILFFAAAVAIAGKFIPCTDVAPIQIISHIPRPSNEPELGEDNE